MYKFIFYAPLESAEVVKNEIFKTGAGSIGEYKNCSFETRGTGQFCPIGAASPHIGALNKLERLEELKVEILCLEEQVGPALRALKSSHPYEEPAWEVVKIENERFQEK